jgi:hypothetical protein
MKLYEIESEAKRIGELNGQSEDAYERFVEGLCLLLERKEITNAQFTTVKMLVDPDDFEKKEVENDYTKEQKEKYIEGLGNYCPSCHTLGTIEEDSDFDGLQFHRYMFCSMCGESWSEVYQLIDIQKERV